MHKLLFGILLLGISSISNAQKRNTVDILYILKNSQDTLSAKAFVSVNLFNKNFIDPLSFDKNILIENGKGRTKIKEKDIQWMSFTDFENKKRVFKYIPEIRRMNQFFKIFQSYPVTGPDSFKDIIIFNSNHKAKHGQIPKQHKVQQTR